MMKFARALIGGGLLLVCGMIGSGFINPGFTPADLVGLADLVVVGHLTPAGDQVWQLDNIEEIKGSLSVPLRLRLPEGADDAQLRFGSTVGDGATAVLLRGRNEGGQPTAFCFVNGSWFEVDANGREWRLRAYNQNMLGTFAGDAEMLGRMARRLVANPDLGIPSTAGVRWFAAPVVGTVEGARKLDLIRIGEAGRPHLYVAAEGGDRIFEVRGRRNFSDLTEQVGLTAGSRLVAILDATQNGHDDVVSWDGQALRLFTFADGRYDGGRLLLNKVECLGLMPVALDGRPGVLISRPTTPLLLLRQGEDWLEFELPAGQPPAGEVGPAVAADFNQNGRFDILQTGSQGSRLWRGTADGFAAPVASPVKGGPGSRFALADFDEDGWLDLYVNSAQHHGIWENDRAGGFREVTHQAGWYGGKAVVNAVAAFAEDLNHTNMPDIGLIYERDPVQYHFNRGFRTFAEEGEVRLAELPAGTRPAAAITADFNRDGSADLAVVVDDGQVVVFFNDLYDLPALRVMPPPTVDNAPITLTVYDGSEADAARRLGVYSVVNGGPGRHLTLGRESTATLVWRNAAGEEQRIVVEADPMQTIPVVLEPAR